MTLEERQIKLRQIFRDVLPQVKANLECDGSVSPVIFAPCDDGDLEIIPLRFKTISQKRSAYKNAGYYLKQRNACGAVAVNEAWVVMGKDADQSLSPSQHPDRQECLSIILTTASRPRSCNTLLPTLNVAPMRLQRQLRVTRRVLKRSRKDAKRRIVLRCVDHCRNIPRFHVLAAPLARENRMRCVLVGTGLSPIEELCYAEPDEYLADLQDMESILALLTRI